MKSQTHCLTQQQALRSLSLLQSAPLKSTGYRSSPGFPEPLESPPAPVTPELASRLAAGGTPCARTSGAASTGCRHGRAVRRELRARPPQRPAAEERGGAGSPRGAGRRCPSPAKPAVTGALLSSATVTRLRTAAGKRGCCATRVGRRNQRTTAALG